MTQNDRIVPKKRLDWREQMIKSMTGFGRGKYQDEVRTVTVEIRAVNHRYCDIYVKLPRKYSFAEEKIKGEIKKYLSRGKIEVSVNIDNHGTSENAVRLDEALAANYYEALTKLSDTFLSEDIDLVGRSKISLDLLAGMPDVLKVAPAEEDEDAITKAFLDATDEAAKDICTMREAEGAKLASDLLMRADIIESLTGRISQRAPSIEAEYAAKFKERVEELLQGVAEVPSERVALEAAIFADKANITEELVRLGSHIQQLRDFLNKGNEAIGKKIDFLVQEMNREANTIGSKSNDNDITNMMLELKAEIEKIREQVQNIE